jgi:NAD(P)H-nitrite reductase large subunit
MTATETPICRCEMILRGAVEQAIAEGNVTINDIKRRTRAGMGVCQGIYCTGAIADALIEAGVEASAIEPMTARPPTRLINLGAAASSVPTTE